MTIPIALLMGAGLRSGLFNVSWITAFGIVGLFFAVWGGQFLGNFPAIEAWFRHSDRWLAWAIMAYGLAASILPVWMLLTPTRLSQHVSENRHGRRPRCGGGC